MPFVLEFQATACEYIKAYRYHHLLTSLNLYYHRGLQTKILNKANSPGPAAYGGGDINVKLNRAPIYSMQPRTAIPGENVGPGPNYYDLMYYRPGRSGPGYSFGVRHHQFAPPMIVRCDNM